MGREKVAGRNFQSVLAKNTAVKGSKLLQ